MNFNKKLLSITLISTCVAGAATAQGLFDRLAKMGDKGTQAAAANTAMQYDPAGDTLAQAQTLVRKINSEKIKGVNKLVIGQFEVQFLERIEASATTSNQLRQVGKDDQARAYVSLLMKGHERAEFQKITDDLYAKLKLDLTAAGFELAPLDSLPDPRDTSAMARFMKDTAQTRPLELDSTGGKSVSYAPSDFPLYHVNEDMISRQFSTTRGTFSKDPEDIFTPSAKLGMMSYMPAMSHLSSMMYIKPNNVLFVRYVVSPGSTRGEVNKFGDGSITDSFGQTLGAKADITPHLVIANDQTRFILGTAHNSGASFSLISPVWSSESLGVVANTTDQGKKTAENIGNSLMSVLGAFNSMGGGQMATVNTSTEEYTLVTKPEIYNPQAAKYLEGVQKMLLQSMVAATK
jgi:hypothetical protein